jgi:hypothetical protein
MGKKLLLFVLLIAFTLCEVELYAQALDDNASLASRGTARRDQSVAKEIRSAGAQYVGEFYPNPAQSKVEVVFTIPQDGKLTVYNLLGSPVYTRALDKSARVAEIDVAGLNEGVYFCTFSVGSEKFATRRMVIKR